MSFYLCLANVIKCHKVFCKQAVFLSFCCFFNLWSDCAHTFFHSKIIHVTQENYQHGFSWRLSCEREHRLLVDKRIKCIYQAQTPRVICTPPCLFLLNQLAICKRNFFGTKVGLNRVAFTVRQLAIGCASLAAWL